MLVFTWMVGKRNGGTPGVDGVSIEEFEERLEEELSQLSKEFKCWDYKPNPVRRVEIPKPGKNAGVRLLGVPCVRDRVVQATLKLLLEPILDPMFSDNSYGFRPDRGQQDAIQAAQRIVETGKEYVVALSRYVKFLGMTIIAGTIAISAVLMERAMAKVRELTPRGTYLTLEETVKRINQWYIGWSGYYRMTQYPSQLGRIEAHIRRRLRSRIIGQQKRRCHLFRNDGGWGIDRMTGKDCRYQHHKNSPNAAPLYPGKNKQNFSPSHPASFLL